MKITSDWHVHSQNSCDSACMTIADLQSGSAGKGVIDLGLTDHVHTPFNLPDIEASRREYLESKPSPRFHFGVEVSCVSRWELDQLAKGKCEGQVYGTREGGPPGCEPAIGIDEADIEKYGIEYVVAGTHWRLYVALERDAIISDYHRQNMFLACHPLVDIVAHPWWWMGYWQEADGSYRSDPWLDDFGKIPRSMHDEFASAVVENGKVVEINLAAMLLNSKYPEKFRMRYVDEYLGFLKSRGVTFSIGSDWHRGQYDVDLKAAGVLLDRIGVRDTDLWRLPPREDGTGI